MLDWSRNTVATTFEALTKRIDRLVDSLGDQGRKFATAYALSAGADGQLVPHGQRFAPRGVTHQLVGSSPSTAVVTVGEIGPQYVRIYTTANCTADLYAEI